MTNDSLNKLIAATTHERVKILDSRSRCNTAIVMKWRDLTMPVMMQIAQKGVDFIAKVLECDSDTDMESLIAWATQIQAECNEYISSADPSAWGGDCGN